MKKLILLLAICFAGCKTANIITTQPGTPEVVWDGKTICIGETFTAYADTNALKKGVTLGDEINFISVKYKDGTLTVMGHGCYQLIR